MVISWDCVADNAFEICRPQDRAVRTCSRTKQFLNPRNSKQNKSRKHDGNLQKACRTIPNFDLSEIGGWAAQASPSGFGMQSMLLLLLLLGAERLLVLGGTFDALNDAVNRTDLATVPYGLLFDASTLPDGVTLTLPRASTKGSFVASRTAFPFHIFGFAGALWTLSQLHVQSGFEAEFRFRITDPSPCAWEPFPSSCESVRGGHGLAFVLHNSPAGPAAFGSAGPGLGYDGIENSVRFLLLSSVSSGPSQPFCSFDQRYFPVSCLTPRSFSARRGD